MSSSARPLFESTLPHDPAELMRVSEFERQLSDDAGAGHAEAGATRLSSLNPSLLQDLMRFERSHRPGEGLDVLEVLAASLRHSRPLLMHLQVDYRVLPLGVLPAQRLLHTPVPLPQLVQLRLPELRVLRVQQTLLRDGVPLDDQGIAVPGMAEPLGPWVWELALRGSREALLPEIGGVAAYRVAPGTDLAGLDIGGSLAAAIARLRQQTSPLREIASWPGFDRERAMRMLNGLYLQAALMVSRTHPSAIDNT